MTAPSAPATKSAQRLRLGALLCSWGVYILWANDGRLYWHDVRYLYATSTYSLSELFGGVWNPQYGESLDAASSGGFYLVKFTLLAALEALFGVWPADEGGFAFAGTVSLWGVGAGALLARPLLERFIDASRPESPAVGVGGREDEAPALATWATCLLLVSPAVMWLGGKVLGESLALGLSVASCLCLLRRDGRPAALISGAGLLVLSLHLLCVGARPNFGLVAPAMCVALASVASASDRAHWLRWIAALVATQGLTHGVLFASYGGGESFFGYLGDYVAGSRSAVISLLGGLAALGVLTPLALAAAWSPHREARRLLLRWTLFTLGPALVFAALYQVEARYLLPGFVPLAGLAGLGASAIWQRIRGCIDAPLWRGLSAGALVVAIVGANGAAGSILPDEIDSRALDRIVHHPALYPEPGLRPAHALMLPWAYSDYHYLVSLHPKHDFRFAHVPRVDGVLQAYSPEWRGRLADWYGADRLVLDRPALDALLEQGPVFMLWWGVHPPLERWARRLDGVGFAGAAQAVRALGGDPHGDQTWLVEESDLVRIPVAEDGIYRLERIEIAD